MHEGPMMVKIADTRVELTSSDVRQTPQVENIYRLYHLNTLQKPLAKKGQRSLEGRTLLGADVTFDPAVG
jgi:hypothetical protein